jgi:hypothetical protein
MLAMKRQWLCLLSGLTLVVALGIVLGIAFQPGKRVRSQYDSILDGMTERQVQMILGGPPGDYAPTQEFVLVGRSNRTKHPTGEELLIWVFDGCYVEVLLNEDGRVTRKTWNEIDRPPLLDRLRFFVGI